MFRSYFSSVGHSKTRSWVRRSNVDRHSFYEGHSQEDVTFGTRLCRMLNVETMFVTNAAGGLNPGYRVGDIVLLNDVLDSPCLGLINSTADHMCSTCTFRGWSASTLSEVRMRMSSVHASPRCQTHMISTSGGGRIGPGVNLASVAGVECCMKASTAISAGRRRSSIRI